ncbi:hypothetical protein QJQ45_005954 [Haematococcus lacustris]|nr:hypothetical protein QJQ45_005954 [Haematococcus lacustris]
MDWFNSQLRTGLARAQEVQERARELAAQATIQARHLAEQASVQAKVLAERAAEEANARLNSLVPGTVAGTPQASAADPLELQRYAVTDKLLELVSSMTYSLFSDTNMDELGASLPLGAAAVQPGGEVRLLAWQERHALLVLTSSPQLQHLRYALCPKQVYFSLVGHLLPPEAFGLAPLPGSLGAQAAAAEAHAQPTTDPSSTPTTSATTAGVADLLGSLAKAAHQAQAQLASTAAAAASTITSMTHTGSAAAKANSDPSPAASKQASTGGEGGSKASSAAASAVPPLVPAGGKPRPATEAGSRQLGGPTGAVAAAGTAVAAGALAAHLLPSVKSHGSGLDAGSEAAADRQGVEEEGEEGTAAPLGADNESCGLNEADLAALDELGINDSGEQDGACPEDDDLHGLDDDPELAAYLQPSLTPIHALPPPLQEALAADSTADAGPGSELGSGAEDLDDYISQLCSYVQQPCVLQHLPPALSLQLQQTPVAAVCSEAEQCRSRHSQQGSADAEMSADTPAAGQAATPTL